MQPGPVHRVPNKGRAAPEGPSRGGGSPPATLLGQGQQSRRVWGTRPAATGPGKKGQGRHTPAPLPGTPSPSSRPKGAAPPCAPRVAHCQASRQQPCIPPKFSKFSVPAQPLKLLPDDSTFRPPPGVSERPWAPPPTSRRSPGLP